ncbi:MAG: PAS domain S-box protein, partial [Bacteroidia bacterium]|nr:PAS domain S-box protein [Bacteroidia bacterium]
MEKKNLSPEELQEKEVQLHFLRNFIELSSDIFCNLDRTGYCLYINEGFEKITGFKMEEVIGTHFKDYVHEEDLEKTFFSFYERLQGVNSENLQNRLKTKTGEYIYIEWTGKNDEKESVFLVGRNVTEKMKKGTELMEKNKLFNSISASMPVVIYIYNLAEEKFEFISEFVNSLLGYTIEEISEKKIEQLSEMIPKDELKKITESLSVLFTDYTKDITNNSFRIKHKNGNLVRVNSKETVYKRDESGKPTHLLGSVIDITEQFNSERYKEAIVRLQDLQQKRTQKIRSLSLLQGQEEERKRLSRELHDGIGQLLTGIRIRLNDIEGTAENEKFNKGLSEVKSIVLKTIKETRNISNALVPIDLYDFGLDPAIKHMTDYTSQASGKTVYYNSNLNSIRINPTIEIEIFRIVQEALNNSIKYSEASSIDINISYSEKKGNLKVMIIDDG